MRFQVPQFIEVEDKIIGPLTIKQFLFLAAGGGILFILWFFLKFWAFLVSAVIIGVICLALAFFKINGRPLASFLANFFNYLIKPKLYLWKKRD